MARRHQRFSIIALCSAFGKGVLTEKRRFFQLLPSPAGKVSLQGRMRGKFPAVTRKRAAPGRPPLIRPRAGPRAPSPEGEGQRVKNLPLRDRLSPTRCGGSPLAEGARELTRSLCPLYYKGASAPRGTARRERPLACGGSRSAGTGSGSVPHRFRRAAAP